MRLRNGQAAGETSGPRKPTSLRQDPLISTLPGRFTILEELGRGGMGVVYRAKHELTGGEVAIKVLSSTLASDSDSVRRFIREARAGTLIDNDNIVRVLDMDVTTEDRLFLVMEYLKGKTLQELIGGNQLTWERAKPIILQVCGALAAAHKQGVVHRDLKPENIFLIEKNGRGNFVKVLDFGLAKFLDLGKESGQLTAVGIAVGTPQFMSPEQALGKPVDHRTDIYALGIMMYQMLTGVVPFNDQSNAVILNMQINHQPKPPSKVCSDIPLPVESIILRALEKDPNNRFQSIEDLVGAINEDNEERTVVEPARGIVSDSVVLPPTTEIMERRLRQPRLFIVGAAAAAIATFATVFLLFKPVRTNELKQPVERAEIATPERREEPKQVIKKDVTLVFRTTPGGARVFHNNNELGTTPLGIEFQKSDQAATFKIELSGHRPQEVTLIPNSDLEVTRSLERVEKPRRPKAKKVEKIRIVDPE